jgi:hypothetical protein
MKAELVFSITGSSPIRVGETSPLRSSGRRSAKSRVCPQVPSLIRSGEEADFTDGLPQPGQLACDADAVGWQPFQIIEQLCVI